MKEALKNTPATISTTSQTFSPMTTIGLDVNESQRVLELHPIIDALCLLGCVVTDGDIPRISITPTNSS
jgi:hypothetical protein